MLFFLNDRPTLSVNDRARVVAWLENMGFKVESSADTWERDHLIKFSGTVGQAQTVFRVEIHRFPGDRFANTTRPFIPAVLEPFIAQLQGLYNFPDTGVH